ncbi:ATP-binding cassette domain-containing protein [Streptomyces sp. NPDC048282]|uniref:ATP-binding cassette domain-containing protein n=1 Tax=Streptomyces sp. NPDC048282 TaxID=3365528 RepID=UPI00371BAF05
MTPPRADPEAAVELRGITERFPGTLANDSVDLTVHRGGIHALMGENGAGKSTPMAVLHGMERPDAGTVRVDGRAVDFAGPSGASSRRAGSTSAPSRTSTTS